jgi:hypothetical protein
LLCCSVCDDASLTLNTVDLIDEVESAFESPKDVILEELVMQAMDDKQEFPKALQLLNDPNIFIGDTGASVDMTPNKSCLTDSKTCDMTVHVGNSEHTSATHSGRLPAMVCDKKGVEQFKITFPEMHVVPSAPYNIISLTLRMENGWDLGGNKHDGIWIEKDGVRICFDIRIETRKGVIWAACFKPSTVRQQLLPPILMLKLIFSKLMFDWAT